MKKSTASNSLLARKEALTEAQAGLNTEIEELKSNYARLEGIDASIEQSIASLEETRASEQQMRFSDSVEVDENVRALSKLSSAEEYEVKTLLDDLDEERLKYEHALDSAKRGVAKSTTAFETLINDHDFQTEQDRAKKQRRIRLIIAFGCCSYAWASSASRFSDRGVRWVRSRIRSLRRDRVSLRASCCSRRHRCQHASFKNGRGV